MLMLSVNKEANYIIFDRGCNRFTHTCMNYIQNEYPTTKIDVFYGYPKDMIYQYIHMIKNCHFIDVCYIIPSNSFGDDISNCHKLLCDHGYMMIMKNDTIIMDDIQRYTNELNIYFCSLSDELYVGYISLNNPINYIDHIIYINLDNRDDRRRNICKSLAEFNFKNDQISRFPAFRTNPGFYGAHHSHIEALKLALSKKYKNVLILEDDIIFSVSKTELNHDLEYIFEEFHDQWDVIMFSCNPSQVETYKNDNVLGRIRKTQGAAAYLVNGPYIQKLLNNFERAYPKLCTSGQHWNYLHDVCWQSLQKTDNWFYLMRTPCTCDTDNKSDSGEQRPDQK